MQPPENPEDVSLSQTSTDIIRKGNAGGVLRETVVGPLPSLMIEPTTVGESPTTKRADNEANPGSPPVGKENSKSHLETDVHGSVLKVQTVARGYMARRRLRRMIGVLAGEAVYNLEVIEVAPWCQMRTAVRVPVTAAIGHEVAILPFDEAYQLWYHNLPVIVAATLGRLGEDRCMPLLLTNASEDQLCIPQYTPLARFVVDPVVVRSNADRRVLVRSVRVIQIHWRAHRILRWWNALDAGGAGGFAAEVNPVDALDSQGLAVIRLRGSGPKDTALMRPDYSKDFYIHVDMASSVGIGAVLMQREDIGDADSLRPVAFWARKFTEVNPVDALDSQELTVIRLRGSGPKDTSIVQPNMRVVAFMKFGAETRRTEYVGTVLEKCLDGQLFAWLVQFDEHCTATKVELIPNKRIAHTEQLTRRGQWRTLYDETPRFAGTSGASCTECSFPCTTRVCVICGTDQQADPVRATRGRTYDEPVRPRDAVPLQAPLPAMHPASPMAEPAEPWDLNGDSSEEEEQPAPPRSPPQRVASSLIEETRLVVGDRDVYLMAEFLAMVDDIRPVVRERSQPPRQATVDGAARAERDARGLEEESYLGFRISTFEVGITYDGLPQSLRRVTITPYLVELWWDPKQHGQEVCKYLRRWLHADFLSQTLLPVGITYYYDGDQHSWIPWTLVCEDLVLQRNGFPDQMGLFALQELSVGQVILRYRGKLLATCKRDSRAYRAAVTSVLESASSSYLIELESSQAGYVDLIDGATDREAGAKIANTAHGLKYNGEQIVNCAHIEPNGNLVVTRNVTPLAGLADMYASTIFVGYNAPTGLQYSDRLMPKSSGASL